MALNQKVGLKFKTAIRALAKYGPDAFQPKKLQDGKWAKPMISRRMAADLRSHSLREGTWGSFSPITGGWDSSWDSYKRPKIRRPLKTSKRDRTRDDRFERIQGKMGEQDAKRAEYRKARVDAKPPPGIQTLYKRLLAMKGGSK
uniref:MRPL25 domain-containing protein n=1 Tax=Octactis speculum TaxID=3111310 RepID=A0A7S2ATP3_9STRA|mmetsp:Transcript_14882/g.19901  ORF Transcript_14882/g.19901 Transcript_14882/m.19901 type:complete len:144 (+) Transcript_14882:96-527(+)|eukprot:CAMPEP_0185769036 /NCGR_PEP_ID=MMETSP1174-20130828/53328_1 /TAXON_ID=35687 /ORGANISM="Dictyocha speculum, Strain CCMP1381" /LENGTH=143 /DNA_ID=CAMNT_0028453973 /DNA_START=96 /DNA_END=527 /DNA_ORIENTATION=-